MKTLLVLIVGFGLGLIAATAVIIIPMKKHLSKVWDRRIEEREEHREDLRRCFERVAYAKFYSYFHDSKKVDSVLNDMAVEIDIELKK